MEDFAGALELDEPELPLPAELTKLPPALDALLALVALDAAFVPEDAALLVEADDAFGAADATALEPEDAALLVVVEVDDFGAADPTALEPADAMLIY